jgi:thiosulfate dehydrogenase [quinone] large subunit
MSQKITFFLLRISLGWYMLYAGVSHIMDRTWSAEGYLRGAKILPELYTWFASPHVLPIINLVNEWGLALLGVSLILGAFVRFSAPLGALMMLLYYIPLGVIHPDAHSMVVDDHVIFIFALLFFAASDAGRTWGVDQFRG